MTIYCPSCGKPNTDQAEKCASCGKELEKPKPAGSKFKGTMMMTGMPAPKPPGAGGQAGPPGGEQGGTPPAQGQPPQAPGGQAEGQPPGAEGGGRKDLAFQQTMLGPMAPPGAPPPPAGPAGAGAPPPAGGTPSERPRIPSPPPPAAGPPGSTSSPGTTPSPSGAPPATAGSSFGAPPQAAASGPAPGAGGGFGAGQGAGGQASAPQGGWGQPAPAQPGDGGWGQAPPAQPMGGGGGGLSDKNKKILIWVAIGCAALAVLGCLVTGVFVFFVGKKAKEASEAGGSFAAQASRVSLGFALTGIETSCQSAGADATAQFFHPKAFPRLEAHACDVDNQVIDVFSNTDKSEASVLSNTDLADKAEDIGLDPDSCYLYQAGDARIIGCSLDDGSFKIIDMENLGGL